MAARDRPVVCLHVGPHDIVPLEFLHVLLQLQRVVVRQRPRRGHGPIALLGRPPIARVKAKEAVVLEAVDLFQDEIRPCDPL